MPVIRVKHNRENPYVMLNRTSLWDAELPLECVGLWARLMSRPDDWVIHTTEIAKTCKINKETVNKYIKILIREGYVFRIQKRSSDENGKYPNRFDEFEYWVFEVKTSQSEVSNILSETGFSAPIESASIKPPVLNTDSHPSSTNVEKDSNSSSSSSLKSTDEYDPTPEEEEILQKKMNLREGSKPILDPLQWKKTALSRMRKADVGSKLRAERCLKNRKEAERHDGQTYKGFMVCALHDRVEFCHPTGKLIVVTYDVTDEEWKRKIVWA